MEKVSYLLISRMPYEGPWIHGVVQSLDEALEYFTQLNVDDPHEYFSYWVEKWCYTEHICTYKYNLKMKLLEKQPTKFGETGEK
jgi:hypothetical protein